MSRTSTATAAQADALLDRAGEMPDATDRLIADLGMTPKEPEP